jgi:outer membrane protein assembly factor BamB
LKKCFAAESEGFSAGARTRNEGESGDSSSFSDAAAAEKTRSQAESTSSTGCQAGPTKTTAFALRPIIEGKARLPENGQPMTLTHRRDPKALAAVCAAILLSFPWIAQGRQGGTNWNQFRGPNGQGAAKAARIPVQFGPDKNVLWKTAIPPGQSSPVIWGDRIFLTAYVPASKKTLITLAVDRGSGRVLWRRRVQAASSARLHALNTPATPTAAADARHVYVYFGTYGLLCYDHDGRELWQRKLPTPRSQYGMATSPILHGANVIMVLDDNGGASRVLAVKRDTGKTAWAQPRPMFRAGWSTPMIWRHDGVEELIVLGYKRLTSYNPATGEENWWAGGFSEETVSVPVTGDGLLFASAAALAGRGDKKTDPAWTWKVTVEQFDRNRDNQIQRSEMTKGFTIPLRPELAKDNPGYGLPMRDMDGLMRWFDRDKDRVITETEWMRIMSGFAGHSQPWIVAFRPGAKDNARPKHVAWELQRGIPETPSILYCQGKLYLLRDGGLLTCLKAATGKELFREKIGAPGQYMASPIVAGDKIIAASVRGIVTIIEVADELKVLARNKFQEKIHATPAIADNTIYLRTAGHLYAFGQAERVPDSAPSWKWRDRYEWH